MLYSLSTLNMIYYLEICFTDYLLEASQSS